MMEEVETNLKEIKTRFPAYKGQGHEICGFVWFQGWNDMFVEGALESYSDNLVNLVRDLSGHLSKPRLPFVVGQTGNANNEELWTAQEKATKWPGFTGRARYVPTRSFLRKPEDSPNTSFST